MRHTSSSNRVRMYDNGNLQFHDTRVGDSTSFAHVVDLHLAPDPLVWRSFGCSIVVAKLLSCHIGSKTGKTA